MNKPNFFIIGAPKCGTTALSDYLKNHPYIFMSNPKEPDYFAEDFNRTEFKTLEQYLQLFAAKKKQHLAVGEASVHYLCSQVALGNIYQFNPQAKLIAMLRNPVDLVYSYHAQLLYNTGEDEADFAQAWKLQSARKTGKFIPKNCRNPQVLQYRMIGQLGSQVEKLFNIFPSQQIKIILFDEFELAPQKTYEEVLSFLNIPSDNRRYFPRINTNKTHKNAWLGSFTERTPQSILQVKQVVQNTFGVESFGVMNKIRQLNIDNQERKPLSGEFRLELINEFQQEIEKLSQLINQDLSHWLV